jgi:hypothetical protein
MSFCALPFAGVGCSRTSRDDHDDDHGHVHDHKQDHDHGYDHASGEHAPGEHGHEHEEESPALTEADIVMPRDYDSAVPRIVGFRDAIRSALSSGKPHEAHRPLDESELVLRKLIYIARDSQVPRRDWETVNVSARELRKLFGEIHAAIDENRKPDTALLDAPADALLTALQRVAAGMSPSVPPSSAPPSTVHPSAAQPADVQLSPEQRGPVEPAPLPPSTTKSSSDEPAQRGTP